MSSDHFSFIVDLFYVMDQEDNEFYICLMSNDSLNVYPDNTLASFTNVLARPCKINEEWVCGLSEISFNQIPNARTARLRAPYNPNAESSGDSDSRITIAPNIGERIPLAPGNNNDSVEVFADRPQIVSIKEGAATTASKKWDKIDDRFDEYYQGRFFAEDHESGSYTSPHIYSGDSYSEDSDDKFVVATQSVRCKKKKKQNENASAPLIDKRKRRNTEEPRIQIKVGKTYRIILTYSDLKSVCYQRHDLNGGKLLEIMSEKFVPVDVFNPSADTDLEFTKRLIKMAIMQKIMTQDWTKQPQIVRKAASNEFTVHVYMGPRSDNVSLSYATYERIEDFIEFIIYQLPIEKRNKENLLLLFNIFLHTYSVNEFLANEAKNGSKQPNNSQVKIFFDEYGVNANLDTRSFGVSPIDLRTLVSKFREGLVFKNESQLSDDDKKAIRLAIGNAVLDVMRGNKLTGAQVSKQAGANTINLLVPYAKDPDDGTYKTFSAIVEPKQYKRMHDFLTEIMNQLPPKKRNQNVFIGALDRVFRETEGLTEKRDSVYHDSVERTTNTAPTAAITQTTSMTVAQLQADTSGTVNFVYVYTDLIRPRYIASSFARFLRVIPLTADRRHIRFENIEYVPIERTFFESVSILLTDAYGERIKFNASTIPTFVVLHFKKKYINLSRK